MRMNDAFIDAFNVKPRKACRRKAWPKRIELRASRRISQASQDVELLLLVSAEIGYNEEDTLTIPYSPTTEDICADDWEVA